MERTDVIRLLAFYRDFKRELAMTDCLNIDPAEKSETVKLMWDVKGEVIAALDSLECVQKEIIFQKYIQLRKWGWICTNHHYSDRQARNLGNKGLEKMGKRLSGSQPVQRFLQRKQ